MRPDRPGGEGKPTALTSIRRALWSAANRWGGRRLRAWSQNDQYRRGRWTRLAESRRPAVAELVTTLADGGAVVEFGCGEGHLARRVDPASYRSYVGYDIAEVAVARARELAGTDRCRFEVLDCTAWDGAHGLTLIVAEECLYYLRGGDLHRFLERCRDSLASDGAMLATFHRGGRYPETEAECRRVFARVEEIGDPEGGRYLVLRPGTGAGID